MHALIIEDEKPAAMQLRRLLERHEKELKISGPLASISQSVAWLESNEHPDLIFMDIHLADGSSFEIFKKVKIKTPIIFCTAFDQYALEAFKVNSLDYLLKPIEPEDLNRALAKFKSRAEPPAFDQKMLVNLLSNTPANYKSRFVVKVGEKLVVVNTDEIDFFFSEDKFTYLQTQLGKQYIIDYSLGQLEEITDPNQFFRISRKYLVKLQAIEEVNSYSSSRLKLKLRNCNDSETLVSRDRTSAFKQWLDQ